MIKIIENFITPLEQTEILNYLKTININSNVSNKHIKEISDSLNGFVIMHDFTRTEISSYVSSFQSDNNLVLNIPKIFYDLKDRIAETLNLSKYNVFVQIIKMKKGGQIKSHYDTGWLNHITYKCNICAKGEDDYIIHLDDIDSKKIKELSLYSFSANLYKHHVDVYNSERVLLSYGFIIPCEELGYSKDDARIRMANRIVKYYQK